MTTLPIRGTTQVYAVIGDPIRHSLSPAMQNAAFAALGLDAVYVALHVTPPQLAAAVRGLAAAGVAGFNVTVPHKEAMLPLVDRLDPRARACGAVNTVERTARGWTGHNTDGDGFLASLGDARCDPRGTTALVIGAGGSARSVAWALLQAGVTELVIANRTESRATVLAHVLTSGGRTRSARRRTATHKGQLAGARGPARRPIVHATGLDVLADASTLERCELIVNCTTTGLAGDALPKIAFAATPRRALCCDLVYGRTPSRFLAGAAAAGRRTIDGRGMLLHQGALAFRIWTGRAAPIAVMRRALARALESAGSR